MSTEKESWIYTTKGFFILLLTLSNIFVWTAYFLITNIYESNSAKAGQLGDTFGVITSFFSTLTFAGLMYSIFVQRKEMIEQNDINAAQLQTNMLIQSTTEIQRFENTFYRMIERLELARKVIQISDDAGAYTYTGASAFSLILTKVNEFFIVNSEPMSYKRENHSEISKMYKRGNQSHMHIVPYYNEFENMLILITDSALPLSVRRFYVRILRTYLANEYELVLLYYYIAFQINPPEQQKDEILRLQLFKTMPFSKFPDSPELTYNDWLFSNERLDRLNEELASLTKTTM